MALETGAKSAKAGTKDPNPNQTMKPKLDIKTRENDSKNTKRYGHCGASVRSEDSETTLQDTANAAANVSAEPRNSIQPDERYKRRSGLPKEDVELEVAKFLARMKNDPNYSAPVQKKPRSKRNVNRQGRRSQGHT